MIKIERLTNGVEEEVNRLADGPTESDLFSFENVLLQQFSAAEEAVHVITGSLKSSMRIASRIEPTHWEGIISFGGPSTGVYNPVDYAEYERSRGGLHDFFVPIEALSDRYIQAMNKFLGG